MKAASYIKYGPPEVISLGEAEKPRPKANELLVKIHAATVTSGDVRLRASDFPPLFWLPARLIFGLFKPKKKILGHEFSGVVETVGAKVTKFKAGDEVFGTTTMLSGGSYAEYVCVPENWKSGVIGLKPSNLPFRESAALPIGSMTAIFLLRKAKVDKGNNVLIYGASGSVGSYAVQVAKNHGAKVTGVCSTGNIEMVKSLGADAVVDYKNRDYTTLSKEFDVVFDAVGKTSKAAARQVLKPAGSFVSINMLTAEKDEDLETIREWAEAGKLKPFIDKIYRLEDIVEAHHYVDSGRKRGNVVIEVILV